MSEIGPIEPVALVGIEPAGDVGDAPMLEWVNPRELLVDRGYQRNLSERSTKLIRAMVAGWDWRKYKPVVLSMTDAGLEIIDGQHRAIAAASHPGIEKIPAMIVIAPEREQRAAGFIGQNTANVGITQPQLHHAGIAAADPTALAIEAVCEAAGAKVLKAQPHKFKIGETLAITAIAGLLQKHGGDVTTERLKILVAAECAPITTPQIRAVDLLMTDAEFANQFEPADLAATIKSMGSAADLEGKTFAATHCVPQWRGLASVWFKKVRKRRPGSAVAAAAPVPKPSPPTPAAAMIDATTEIEHSAPPIRADRMMPVTAIKPRLLPPSTPARTAALAMAANIKPQDDRAATFGWEPGNVIRRCKGCDSRFLGGLNARKCADCAYQQEDRLAVGAD